MTPSLPCAICGQADDLVTIRPLGTHADKVLDEYFRPIKRFRRREQCINRLENAKQVLEQLPNWFGDHTHISA